MNKTQKFTVGLLAVLVVGTVFYFTVGKKVTRKAAPIKLTQENQSSREGINSENRSPISGLECANWKGRPVAVMQPADVPARPAAGFSDADMVIEMPAFTSSVTRLLGVYLCTVPDQIGAMRSARHDYLHLAKGLDAVFVHWGYSRFAEGLLERKILDNINCLVTDCPRWDWQKLGMRMEDSGYITRDLINQSMEKAGYRTEGSFEGYPHQTEAPLENRPKGGNLRVAFAEPYDAEYDYDRESNSYFRTWGGKPDTDRNNGKRIAPKNIAVLFSKSEQVKLSFDYQGKGVQNPWDLVPAEEQAGLDYNGIGRYNNMELGDPWFDTTDNGDAFYYFNGQEYKGTWKKDRSRMESKLFLYDAAGKEVQFVPGQIWVEILEPGQRLRWEPQA